MRRYIYILLFAVIPALAFSGETLQGLTPFTKEAGDSAYSQRRFAEAVEIYEKVIDNEGGSVELYYNLGNAAYRSNQLGKAILGYERALRIDPTDEDTRANLEFVQSRMKDEVPEQYEIFFVTWMTALFNLLGINTWAIIGVVAFVVALIGILLLLFSSKGSKRNLLIAIVAFSVFVAIFANIAVYNIHANITDNSYAIVMNEEVSLKSTPDNSGTVLIKVHEGRKVRIVDDTLKDWKEIELEDGKVGWVKTDAIERI